jgi:Undecaprenyl-phosphate glucose phosphotransferase
MSIGSELSHKRQLEDLSSARPSRLSSDAIPFLLSALDGVVILLSSLLGGIGYQVLAGDPISSIPPYLSVGLLASVIYIVRMNGKGFYAFPDCAKPRVEVSDILVCWCTTALMLALFAFLLKVGVDYSRGSFVIFSFLVPVGLVGARKVTKVALAEAVSRGSVGRRNAVLLGAIDQISAFEPQDLLALFGSAEINRFILSTESDGSERLIADRRIIESALNFVRRNDCREILLALPWDDTDRIEFVRDEIKAIPVAARLLPDAKVRSLTNYASSARQQVLTIEMQRAPLSAMQRLVKRILDIALASLALMFFLPIMTLTAIAIRLDGPGPVIFRQNRNGFNGRQFVIFKFRTMTVQENGSAVLQATRDDPRVTSIGRLLRSASIDELPQLFNVLKGDMSLIGPRPHALAHDSYFENVLSDYAYRHHVKPGITGWAQCNGARGATPTIEQISKRIELDLWYINNWSLWLDLQILIKTLFEVLRKRNAY